MSLSGPTVTNVEGLVPNPAFSGLVSSLMPSDLGFAANDLFPRLPFTSNGNGMGYFIRYNMADNFNLLNGEDLVRRPGSAAKKLNRSRRLETFQITQRHLDAVVPDQIAQLVRAQTGGADDPNVTEVQFVREQMLLEKEYRAAQLAKANTSVGGYATPAVLWDAYSNAASDPIGDLTAARMAVRQQSGLEANTMALDWNVALKLSYHPKVRSNGGLRGLSERAPITIEALVEILKALLGFDRVIVLKSMYQGGALKRNPSLNLQTIWGKSVWVYHQPSGPALNKVIWGGEPLDTYYYGGLDTAGVFTFYDNDHEQTVHRIKEDSDFRIFNPELAYRFDNVVA